MTFFVSAHEIHSRNIRHGWIAHRFGALVAGGGKKVFMQVGITLTTAMCEQTMGMRLDEVVKHWYALRPWKSKTIKEVELEVLSEVERLIHEKGNAMPGVEHALGLCTAHGLKLGVASSSYLQLIEAVLKKLGIRNRFEVVHSAEFEEKGKPHPDIYLSAAKMLGVLPGHCIAFEDSYNGLLSAKTAGMRTVAVPAPQHYNDSKFVIADVKVPSLAHLNEGSLKHL